MKKNVQIQLTLLLFTVIPYFAKAQFKWPNGAKAAICLTYDDALDGHLDNAIPQLDSVGLKGTFYCTGNSPTLYRRMDDWRKAAENGHELGNHTLFHPCLGVKPDGRVMDWVKPEYDLRNYTYARLMNELITANTLLKAIDGKESRTYGYTCSDCMAGETNFTDSLKKLFTAARSDGSIPSTMKGYNVYKTPSWGVNSPTAEQLIAYVNEAKEKGTIAIFMFHSVGGGYLNVGNAEHRKLLQYIKNNQKDFYCATFEEVMEYIKENSK
ncbi:MAG TPA: polysaccharide deacetylase family protein [Prolixibacteraceae bacterium]|nr:polysaccharide deacetylase family protein [Prolixibacteraceae bacterium]